jgi:hypothetical protein
MSIAVAREPLAPIAPPVPEAEAPARLARAVGPPAGEPASAFAQLLQSLGREIHRGESLTRSALGAAGGARAIGPGELIALQAGIYRYGEAVDLASRLIDRATSAVKTVLQGS